MSPVLRLEHRAEAVQVAHHVGVGPVPVVHQLPHPGEELILGHVHERAEKEDVRPVPADVGEHDLAVRDSGPGRQHGVHDGAEAAQHQHGSRQEQQRVGCDRWVDRGQQDGDHDPVDRDHDVRFPVGERGEIEVSPVGGAEHRLHAAARTEFLLLLLLLAFLPLARHRWRDRRIGLVVQGATS
jgi:hypothetical protein